MQKFKNQVLPNTYGQNHQHFFLFHAENVPYYLPKMKCMSVDFNSDFYSLPIPYLFNKPICRIEQNEQSYSWWNGM
jgi:hypothetical protein